MSIRNRGGRETEPLISSVSSIRNGVSTVWRVMSVFGIIGAICAAALAIVGLVYAYNAWQGQGAQSLRTNQVESTLVSAQNSLEAADALLASQLSLVNTTLCNKIMAVNTTLNDELGLINGFLNITNGTFSQFIQSTIAAALVPLESASSQLQLDVNNRLATINNVPGSNGTHNIDLIAGLGVTVTPIPALNQVQLDNTGVITVNGVPSGSMAPGQLELLGIGMINIINTPNSSQVTIDGGDIVTTLVNLQNENSIQMMDIMNLQNTTSALQMQLNAIQMAENLITAQLNGTQIEFNMTIMTLLTQVSLQEMQIAALTAQLANLTAIATPTGTLVPWTGTALNVPSGYLLADGTEYSQVTYMDLYAVINTMYCPGPCTIGMFAVPDMRGRVPVGMAPSGQFNTAIGTVVGVETSTLTTNELPAHTHSGTTTGGGSHQHTFEVSLDQDSAYNPISGSDCQVANHIQVANCGGTVSPKYVKMQLPTEFPPFDISSAELFGDHQHTFTTASSGLGAGFTNVQPSVVMHYMIKT